MSNYTHKRRAVGGPNTQALTAEMTEAVLVSAMQLHVSYNQPVTAASFTETHFETQPSGTVCGSISQLEAAKLLLDFADPIDSDVSLTYAGDRPATLSPQTISIT